MTILRSQIERSQELQARIVQDHISTDHLNQVLNHLVLSALSRRNREKVGHILKRMQYLLLVSDVLTEQWRDLIAEQALMLLPDLPFHRHMTLIVQIFISNQLF